MEEASRERRDAEAERLVFGVFEMDLRSGELRKGGTLVRIAPQPFQILALLARRPREVVTREEVRRAVWGDGTVVDFDQRLNSCITQIRQALGDDAEVPRYVETLPRRGYRWVGPAEVVTLSTDTQRPPLHLVSAPDPAADETAVPPAAARHRVLPWVHAAVTLALVGIVAALYSSRSKPNDAVSWSRASYRRGYVASARFSPSGEIVFAGAFEAEPLGLQSVRPPAPDAGRVEIPPFSMFVGLSALGEAAYLTSDTSVGMLFRVPIAGGTPKAVLQRVLAADWMPDGRDLAVVRIEDGMPRVELPIGHVVGPADGPSLLRVSPDGQRVALLEHPVRGDDAGRVVVFDRAGKRTVLGGEWASLAGLAWSPKGDEVWFTATKAGMDLDLHAVTLDGRVRKVLAGGSRLVLHDIAKDGRVLVDRGTMRIGCAFGREGQPERDLSWFDATSAVKLSSDGELALLAESGEAGGADYGVYLRRTDGSPPARLGSGRPTDLSPDGKWVLAIPMRQRDHIDVLPTGAGDKREIKPAGFERFEWAGFFPDSSRVLFVGMRKGQDRWETLVTDMDGANTFCVGSFRMRRNTLSPDGSLLTRWGSDGQVLQAVESTAKGIAADLDAKERDRYGGMPIPGLGPDVPMFWDATGRTLFVRSQKPAPARIDRLDVRTGKREPWKTLMTTDPVGIQSVIDVVGTPDGKAWSYTYVRRLSELHVIEGLR